MNLGEVVRTPPTREHHLDEPRTKCSYCCALKSASVVLVGTLAIFSIPAVAVHGGPKFFIFQASWFQIADRLFHVPLPLALVSFTHAAFLSEYLWSRNKRSLYDVLWVSQCSNMGLWCALIACGTFLSRQVLQVKSRRYRLMMWDFEREQRVRTFSLLPDFLGKVSTQHNWSFWFWMLSSYHITAYIFFRASDTKSNLYIVNADTWFGKVCSPQWREWRDVEIHNRYVANKEAKFIAHHRWANAVTDTFKPKNVS